MFDCIIEFSEYFETLAIDTITLNFKSHDNATEYLKSSHAMKSTNDNKKTAISHEARPPQTNTIAPSALKKDREYLKVTMRAGLNGKQIFCFFIYQNQNPLLIGQWILDFEAFSCDDQSRAEFDFEEAKHTKNLSPLGPVLTETRFCGFSSHQDQD